MFHIYPEQNDAAEDLDNPLESDGYANLPSELASINLLEPKQRRKELFSFHPQHSESATHCLSFHEKNKYFIPVPIPIGPSILQRDQEKTMHSIAD